MQKIKSAALALPALLLAGCAAALPAENTATIETAAAAAPQTLKVYTSASLAPAAQAYAEAQGVALTLTDEAASADLLLTDHAPGGSLLDVTSDTLLAAAAARAGITENANALPLGRSLYGYWARADVLNTLLGDGAAAALQTANWEEWSDFVETLSAWMTEPKAATVTLSGADYTLPDARPGSLTATGVFAAPLDRASGYTAALLAADGTYTADALTGPLNGVYSAVTLEWDNMTADGGEGIFRRAKLTDLLAEYGADTCNGLVLVPFKCQLDDSDLTAEDYNAEGLLNYPVLADVGSIAINAGTSADGLKAAKSAALKHAGLSSAVFTKAERDYDDGRLEYELEFHTDSAAYEVTVDAATGRVLDYEKENLRGSTGGTDIGAQAAKAAALKHAGLSEGQVQELQVEWDSEHGRAVYEVEFKSGGMEYEYVIDAATGAVLEHQAEQND